MMITSDNELNVFHLPGLRHQTLSTGPGFEVWKQRLMPGAGTPVHRHDCVEVIAVLSGQGVVVEPGGQRPFAAPATLVLRPNEVHQILNTGPEPMDVVAMLQMGPVRVEDPDGAEIPLPWSGPR